MQIRSNKILLVDYEKFEDATKGESKAVNRRTDNTTTTRKTTEGQTMTYKTLPRKLNIEEHEPHYNPEVNSSAPIG